MLFYAVFFVIIAVCTVMLVSILARKFPQLTIIDTAAIPAEREAERKKEIMRARLSRMTGEWGKRVAAGVNRKLDRAREEFRVQYRKVLEIEKQMRKERFMTPAERRERVVGLRAEAEALAKESKIAEAEKKYIEALSFSPRDLDSYRGLGALYLAAKRYEQARETLAYLAKALLRDNRCIHGMGRRSFAAAENSSGCPASSAVHADIAGRFLDLAAACEPLDDRRGARAAYERAVAVEPANPRHLDLLLDACILGGDKERAEEVFAQLERVNPENMKLAALAERLDAMPAPQPAGRKKKAARR